MAKTAEIYAEEDATMEEPPSIALTVSPSATSASSTASPAPQPKPRRQFLSKAKSTLTKPFSTTTATSSSTAHKKSPSKMTNFFKSSHGATKFPRFSDLPSEIRLQIWAHTITPRIHELHPCANLYNNRMTFRSNSSTTPSIFHICHESRMVAMENYQLMEYTPHSTANENGKGILRFYFAPKVDTLLLNSLMGLFVMFMLLEEVHAHDSVLNTGGETRGVMKGWERVAIDAERAQLITLLSGVSGQSPQPKFRKLLPDLKELVVAFDYTRGGKTRFRTSVWPGEDGTTLRAMKVPRGYEDEWAGLMDGCLQPLKGFLKMDYVNGESIVPRDERDRVEVDKLANVPAISTARVKRERYVRGDLRYAFRWSCSLLGVRPRWVFRRL